jgi:hypothetical protein
LLREQRLRRLDAVSGVAESQPHAQRFLDVLWDPRATSAGQVVVGVDEEDGAEFGALRLHRVVEDAGEEPLAASLELDSQ